ncbi:MAG: hypothetical protein KDC49_10010 [Saprospiraceae bacterium]|nr:hypothetical protein [Saprospiraceae bacterium]
MHFKIELKSSKPRVFIFLLSITFAIKGIALDHFWDKVQTGNYNDPANWTDVSGNPLGTIPSPTDNVFLTNADAGHITVIFPAGTTFFANNFYAENATLIFQGSNLNPLFIQVHGDLTFESNVITTYNVPHVNKWSINGPGFKDEHLIDTKNIDLNDLTFDVEGVALNVKSPLTVNATFRFYKGVLLAESTQITVGSMFVGVPGYSSDNALIKDLYLDNSIIICTNLFYSKYNNTGAVTLHGNHTISSPRFFLDDIHLDHAILTNFDPPLDRDELNMDVRNPIINHLEIDNEFLTRIAGSMTINNLLEIIQPGKTIEFSTFENWAYFNELTINGSVTTPPGGPCNLLTMFTIKNENDYFFKRTIGTVTFPRALIHNIKTTGGASFNVTSGKVIGSNAYWNATLNTTSTTYYWVDGSGNWFDAGHWSLQTKTLNNPGACVPRAVDNVIIDDFSFDGSGQEILMDYSIGTKCQDFTWISNPNNGAVTLYKPFGYTQGTKPHVNTGSFTIGPQAVFNTNAAAQLYQIWLDGQGDINIQNNLPGLYLYFKGSGSIFNIDHDLNLDEILSIDGGTFNTNNHDIYARSIQGADGEKTFNLGTSHIESDSLVRLCSNEFSPTTINGSQASVKAKVLQHKPTPLKQIELNNSLLLNLTYDFFAEKLILSGEGIVRNSFDSISVDSLILGNNAKLEIGTNSGAGLRVNYGIRGPGNSLPQASIKSTSSSIKMEMKTVNNLCILGKIALEGVQAVGGTIFHAPESIDIGNNQGINFSPNTFSGNLYWIGFTNEFDPLPNWSNISGGCPTNLTSLKNADTLVVDQYGYHEDDTLFVNNNVSIANISFRGVDKDIFLKLNALFFTGSISLTDLKVEFLGNDGGVGLQTLMRVNQFLDISKGGKFYFENVNMEMGNNYDEYQKPVIGLTKTAGFFDPLIICRGNSTLKILGTSHNTSIQTLKFGPNTGANLSLADFIIVNQSPYNMHFDFRNTKVNSFTIDAPGTIYKDYIFESNLRFKTSLIVQDGNLVIQPGVVIKHENF